MVTDLIGLGWFLACNKFQAATAASICWGGCCAAAVRIQELKDLVDNVLS
jgi:hypothetical protein